MESGSGDQRAQGPQVLARPGQHVTEDKEHLAETSTTDNVLIKRPRTRGEIPVNPDTSVQGETPGKTGNEKKKKRRNNKRRKRVGGVDSSMVPAQITVETGETNNQGTSTKQDQETMDLQTQCQQQDNQAATSQPRPQSDPSHLQTTETKQANPRKEQKVQVQTQTKKPKSRSRETQTPIVTQNTQQTQTDSCETGQTHPGGPSDTTPNQDDGTDPSGPKQNNGNDTTPTKQDGHPDANNLPTGAPTAGEARGNSEGSEAKPTTIQNPDRQEKKDPPSVEGQEAAQNQEGKKPLSYASAVAGKDAETEKGSKVESSKDGDQHRKTSQSRGGRERSPVRSPPGVPMFTFYSYAVLDKKFRFNQEHDKLWLCMKNEHLQLEIITFVGLPGQSGYLLETRISVEESLIPRGQWLTYQYGVQQRQKEIMELADRHIQIPPEPQITELHLYEGHINRMESSSWFWESWTKSKQQQISDAWLKSAVVLLDKTFDQWDPFRKGSTETLAQNLAAFQKTFNPTYPRVFYPDGTNPPFVKISELILERLLQLLRGASHPAKSWIARNPLVLGLSVFMLSRQCDINLGVKGWAELCCLVSLGNALDNKNIEGLRNVLTTPQNTVLGLMNYCAQHTVSELPLLVPLLHTLRQAGADADRLAPTVEEQNWSGLDQVPFSMFRERVHGLPDKRRTMMTLIKSHISLAKEMPLLLVSWLSMVALEDIEEFSKSTGTTPENLIQTLMYRLRKYEEDTDQNKSQQNVEATKKILTHILEKVEKDKKRLLDSGCVLPILLCCFNVLKSTCQMVQLVPFYRTAVLSYQLVLKVAEIHDALAKKDSEEDRPERTKLGKMQQHVSQFRDRLLYHPLLKQSKTLTYPREIEMWDALLRVECSIPGVSAQWASCIEKDLKKRISTSSDVDQVVVCCLPMSVETLNKSHELIQTCLQELCHTAIKNICQAGKEGDLMQTLFSLSHKLPSKVLSSIVVESATRFEQSTVEQLLNPQSSVHHLLLKGDWKVIQVDEEAGEVIASCQRDLGSLVEALCHGDVPLQHLQTALKHRQQFIKIFRQYKINTKVEGLPAKAEELLAQREKDVKKFMEQRNHMDTLIKMMKKVSESITVPEISTLEEQHKADLQPVSLDKLVSVQAYGVEEAPGTLDPDLWYSASLEVLNMAREMHEVLDSNLLLSSWVDGAAEWASAQGSISTPVSTTLARVCREIWTPQLKKFCQLGLRIAAASVTFEELDQALNTMGDQGEGVQMKKEMSLMSARLEGYQEPGWVETRLQKIQEYRQLHNAAASASAVLKIVNQLQLKGDFSEIHSLTQLKEQSFKQRVLGSLTKDLIRAKRHLSTVTLKHTECLEAFLECHKLVSWVKDKNIRDVKVFVDLAFISAGENDADIDRVACFHAAVMGFSPLLYSLKSTANFKEFMTCAGQVWETLRRDKTLPDKLRDSTHSLDWLKELSQTHGSVEQSSLALASAINAQGVYHISWSGKPTEKRCLQSFLWVSVKKDNADKDHSLEELLELQNKLMLMSSKGEHGKEQVNRFTQVFEGVQRLSSILLQMQSSGNMLFREWCAEIQCSEQIQPCIRMSFSSLQGKAMVYHGEVTEQLQGLCRSMEICHEEWCAFLRERRSEFHSLNHYTSEQVLYLCQWIYKISTWQVSVPQQVWHLLSPIKPACTLKDIREAVAQETNLFSKDLTLADCEDEHYEELRGSDDDDEVTELIEFSSDSEEDGMDRHGVDLSPVTHRDPTDEDVQDSVEALWRCFKDDMPRFLKELLDISTLARVLSCLSDMNQQHIKRKLPPALQEGKPNLVLCPVGEALSTTLSFYLESPEKPMPSTDEVLVCQNETTEEQVEIFLRRALGQGVTCSQQRIYTLVNPGMLGYDVSVALGEHFETLERSAGAHYRLVIVSPVIHQHTYVPSFFSNHKVQAGVVLTTEDAKRYLHHHFTVPVRHSSAPLAYPGNLSVWVVSSTRPSVGKSLYVERLFEKFRQRSTNARHVRIRLIEPQIDLDSFLKTLSERLATLREHDPVLLHIDTAAVSVSSGLEEFLFALLVLGCLHDSQGMLWRRNSAHLIVVETLRPALHTQSQKKEMRIGLLDILPTIQCRPPLEVKTLLLSKHGNTRTHEPLMDEQEFASEAIQRPYQFLKRYNRNENLDHFKYPEGSREGDPIDCLHHLLSNCSIKDPSWAELKNFTWFLNVQLKNCEDSVFCDPDFLADHLPGFKNFIVKFMIEMARDFSSPSLNTSDQSPCPFFESNPEDDLLSCLTIRKRWEHQSHPYIFFNADRFSMSFLGFHVQKNPRGNTFNAVDPQSHRVLMGDVMTSKLFEGLQQQKISLTEEFDSLARTEKIKRISRVVGAQKGIMGEFDPDPTYELTADNVMKMLAIQMRFRCGIPVIIMGETGCGKTRLVRFLCDLQREGRNVENLKLIKVHGGTTAEMIYRKVREAETQAQRNHRNHKLDTILFFDEANTTESIFAIKEVLCDKTVEGHPLKTDTGLKIIAACNPYRRHTPEMVERLERAGLGYRVKAEETQDRLGKVPLRQLVYRVHPLPPSMVPLVWDFGQLSDATEFSYIKQIVSKKVKDHGLPDECFRGISMVLATSQSYMRSRKNECSFVSLRDVERSMQVLVWFYLLSEHIFSDFRELGSVQKTWKCLALAVGVCYYPSLSSQDHYLSSISKHFPSTLNSAESLQLEISSCQDLFLKNIETRDTVAKNIALKENVFLMVVCIELKIPLFLVGKPGSSKSLAKTVVDEAMKGHRSNCRLFQKLKQVHMVSFQCSPHSSPEGIIGTFQNCARFQKDQNMDEYVSVVVLDEIGLAEDSPQMPLKTLHPLLEDGCIDNERPDPHMKVGFVGISNWALDPAKMNRGIFLSRWDPSENELVETAKGICSSSSPVLLKIKHLFPQLAKDFLEICDQTKKNQFFGLRDYYSLVKMLFATVKCTGREPDDSQLAEAILRNFSGQPEGFDPLIFFKDIFQNHRDVPMPSTLQMVEQNLDCGNKQESRYLLLLTTNNAALHILQQRVFSKGHYASPEIVFGSGFPKDQEYAQICRNVNRVKSCMETGRTVILLNMQNLYESLYDALNQYYVYYSGQQYVDLGLGSHRVKCRVHKDFRLVVIEDQKKVYEQFPVPLINRLEKHRVDRSTDLTPGQCRVLAKLKQWMQEFSGGDSENFQLSDVFIGFHGDACASALLQALEWREQQTEDGDVHPHLEDSETDPLEEVEANEEVANRRQQDVNSDHEEQKDVLVEKIEDMDMLDDDDPEQQTCTDREGDEVGMEIDLNEEELEIENPIKHTDQEDELFESAKGFMLNCATPDSVLRLKYSDLSNQEKERLQKMYFHQQQHRSLRDFMEVYLSQMNDSSRFVEVTTFSSLLTKSDVRGLASALGLDNQRLLLLSLHQFDTELSFSSKIGGFLRDAGHILFIQMDIEESHCSGELIASAKYCTMNYLITAKSDQNSIVVFITKLSRIPRRSKYIGFQGGVWHSVHIDDLRDTDDMSLNLSLFCGTSISKLLTAVNDCENVQKVQAETAYLHGLSLVRSCVQKAVGLLREPTGMTSRSMKRMHILLALLGDDQADIGARFQEVLLARLAGVLAQREELMPQPGEWVNIEAKKSQSLQEGGTLRHTLWRRLQSTLTPLLAGFVEMLDRNANLDLLFCAGLSPGLTQLWLNILEDKQILDFVTLHSSSGSDQEVPVQHDLLLGVQGHPAAAPFSWLIRMNFHSLLEESEFVPATKENSSYHRILQFVSSVTNSRLGSYLQALSDQEQSEYGHRYLCDFLLLSFQIKSEDELKLFTKAMLGCVADLQRNMNVTPDLSPAWVMAAARHYTPRLDTLSHILLLQPLQPLQPLLASQIVQQGSKTEPSEMSEDILALGICVERTKLQVVSSFEECEAFLRQVELLQPCLDRAFGQKYRALCSPSCRQHLDSIRSIWSGMLVVAAFIQQVMFEAKQRDDRLKELALKHCKLLQKLMQDSPDLRSVGTLQQLMRILNFYHEECISKDLRFGIHCPVCLSELKDPSVLPCGHVFCLPCLQRSIQADRRFCPKCREVIPPNFQPNTSENIKAALQQHAEVRGCCNSFFLEVVSRFCLFDGDKPGEGLIELLFSLLIFAQGDVYKTRQLTPFLECVDNSPVVRSVLPKLLLQYSFEQVKGHIQSYLRNLEENIMNREDRTELYLLFVNCFQDSLHCPGGGRGLEEGRKQQKSLQEEARFLGRVARKQTPGRQEDPAEFLLTMARLRLCLATAATLLQRATAQSQVDSGWSGEVVEYLGQVEAVCDYCGNDWYRVYLLRALNKQAGLDCVLGVMNTPRWAWVFPPEVLRLQRMIPEEVDRFLCCGPAYQALRDGVAMALLENSPDPLITELQKHGGVTPSPLVHLVLALFRQVTCRLASRKANIRPTPQETKMLEDFLKKVVNTEEARAFCISLLSNRIGGLNSPVQISQALTPQRRILVELLVHAGAVLLTGNPLLAPLQQISSQPQSMTVSFLPTMPDDHTSEALQWMVGQGKMQMYYCINDHACFVGECGKPVATSKCPDCGEPVGGMNHKPVSGFTMAGSSVKDRTRTGHILGDARTRIEAPERNLSPAQSRILRLLTHLAMFQGAVMNHQGVSRMIHPHVGDVREFLWRHLEKDMNELGSVLDQNMDDTAVTLHLVLNTCLEFPTAASRHARPDLSSRRGREQWERLVCEAAIDPVIQHLRAKLTKAQHQISADDRLGGSPLMKLLYSDPRSLLPLLNLPSDCPTHHSSFWSLPESLTVERFSQLVGQAQKRTTVPLLALLLRKVQCVRQLHHLPALAALQSDLLLVFPPSADLTNQTIAQLLQQIPAGPQKKGLLARVQIFTEVWNSLRMEVANNSDLGVAPQLCEKELTMDSSGEFLSPCRHGPGSCLQVLLNFLSQTHNSLVSEARRLSHLDHGSDYSVPLEGVSETQLTLCHPERELLPLVLAHCHYTLRKGRAADCSYNLRGIQAQLARSHVTGKPLIKADTSKYLKRHLQDFSVVLTEVRDNIPQEPLKGSVSGAIRSGLRSYTDVCDAVFALEIGLRFLGKMGGKPGDSLLTYLTDTLKMGPQISGSVKKALGESRLGQSLFTWQLLTSWKSELLLNTGQDPFQKLPPEFQEELSDEEKRELGVFLAVTDVETFSLELHEILLLKTNGSAAQEAYPPHWDIRSTMENHLDLKSLKALPGLESLPEELTLNKGASAWRIAVQFIKR
ncbi:E3 ubiquitin-protein ligase rnf213-beta isoform X4 [Hypomesus transpacificus]|uniref:E3 ubiquitin-protein ligase rnf213-beta isoform X4 n=1 Tax=Hypomesus transpacificus TaxID=137520 RepID=UPI001F087CE1|nr:E3 ubiquitin-protein ligase rnf213-beta isoform X4 [Hypomesus transpacificus]